MEFTFFDFFSGIGAGHVALSKLGGKCQGFAEIDKTNEKIYRAINQTPKTKLKNWGNIHEIKNKELPHFDLMLAGFPCQSFSVIGKRKGLNELRGQAIFKILEILEKKPKCFLLENVKGLVNHEQGKTIKKILKMLDRKDYKVFWKVLKSSNFGVPQIRERVYFVGFNKRLIPKNFQFSFPASSPTIFNINKFLNSKSKIFEFTEKSLGWPTFIKNANHQKINLQKFLKKDYSILDTRHTDWRIYFKKCPTLRAARHGIFYSKNGKLRKLSGEEALLMQGFKSFHIKRIHESSNNKLLFQAGNAFTVNVIEAITKQIKEQFLNKVQ